MPGLGVHQDPLAADGDAHFSGLVRQLVDPLHMGTLDPVFPGGDVQHLPGRGAAVDPHRHPGEQKHLPHGVELLMGQPPGVVVIPGEGGGLAQKRGHPGPLVPVTVRKDQFLLAEVSVIHQILLEILQNSSFPLPVSRRDVCVFPFMIARSCLLPQAAEVDFFAARVMMNVSKKRRYLPMNKTVIATTNAPGAIGPYSQGWTAGDLIFTSGQIPVDPATAPSPRASPPRPSRAARTWAPSWPPPV